MAGHTKAILEPTRCPWCKCYYDISFPPLSGRNVSISRPNVRPIILTGCGHTFCEKCLEKSLLTNDFPNRNTHLMLICPKCSLITSCNSLQDLPLNQSIVELLKSVMSCDLQNIPQKNNISFVKNQSNTEFPLGVDRGMKATHSRELTKELGRDCYEQYEHNIGYVRYAEQYRQDAQQSQIMRENNYPLRDKGLKCNGDQDIFHSQRNVHGGDSENYNSSYKFNQFIYAEKYFIDPKVDISVLNSKDRERRQSLNDFPVQNYTSNSTNYGIHAEKRRSRSFSQESSWFNVDQSVPTCPEAVDLLYPNNSVRSCQNIENRMSGYPLRPPAYNPDVIRTKIAPYRSSTEDVNTRSNAARTASKLSCDKDLQRILRRPQEKSRPPSTTYRNRLSAVTSADSNDMISPTRLAISSNGETLAIVDQPSNSVHVVFVQSGRRNHIPVNDVRSCCFVSNEILAITTAGSVKLINTSGHLLEETALDAWPSVACVSMSGKRFCVAYPKQISIYSLKNSCILTRTIKSKTIFERCGLLPFSKKKIIRNFDNIIDLSWNSCNKYFAVLEETQTIQKPDQLSKKHTKSVSGKFPAYLDKPQLSSSEVARVQRNLSVFDESGLVFATFQLSPINNSNHTGTEPVRDPFSIALDRNLGIYISDRESGRIVKFHFHQGCYSISQNLNETNPAADVDTGLRTYGLFLNEELNQLSVIVKNGDFVDVRMFVIQL